jgi:SAM-dependent methyltransferase
MSVWLAELQPVDSAATSGALRLRCPACAAAMGTIFPEAGNPAVDTIGCPGCGFELQQRNGIWNALLPDRERYYARFIAEYEKVRSLEGRGSETADYYLSLPYRDLTGRNSQQWRIRARSWRYLRRRILAPLRRHVGRALQVLDLGAGNGWLSYRLALLGYRAIAVDLLVNDSDGLGAARHYVFRLRAPFPRFRAELDRLPFADGQFDCAIFNASFHYSEDYARTLREAFRCLSPEGKVIIADTAWYRDSASGEQMIRERREAFLRHYGFASDALNSQEFLTDDRLRRLAMSLGIRWEVHRPWYGVRWALRPWTARWKKRREPSRFQIYVGQARA